MRKRGREPRTALLEQLVKESPSEVLNLRPMTGHQVRTNGPYCRVAVPSYDAFMAAHMLIADGGGFRPPLCNSVGLSTAVRRVKGEYVELRRPLQKTDQQSPGAGMMNEKVMRLQAYAVLACPENGASGTDPEFRAKVSSFSPRANYRKGPR